VVTPAAPSAPTPAKPMGMGGTAASTGPSLWDRLTGKA
jgi:hypothetical protein